MDNYILYTPLKIEDVIKSIPNVEDGGFTNIHNSRYNAMYKSSFPNTPKITHISPRPKFPIYIFNLEVFILGYSSLSFPLSV